MSLARAAMWGSLGLIAWTHVGYPLAAAAYARLRRYAPAKDDGFLPEVALVVAAHNEEAGIRARLENALRLDYPRDRLEIVVASDGSTDGTAAAVGAFAGDGVRLLELPRVGKVVAQNAAVRATTGAVVAFSDADTTWDRLALRRLARNFADPEVGYVCGRIDIDVGPDGDNREGLYWRVERWLREQESRCGSLTAGSGAIYGVRRSAYLELGPQHSHDIALPFRLRRRGFRSVYERDALARIDALETTIAEGARKLRMLSRAWWEVVHGGMLDPRGQPPIYFVSLLSHRVLRYASGPLHVVLLAASVALAGEDRAARRLVGAQLGFGLLAAAGRSRTSLPLAGAAWYYTVVSGAAVAALVRVLARGPTTTWTPMRRASP